MKEIIEQYININPYSRPGLIMSGVKGLVYHYTAGPGHTATGINRYFDSLKKQTDRRKGRYASTQFTVGLEGEIVQNMPEIEVAYHCGDGIGNRELFKRLDIKPGKRNFYFIGIEMCIDVNGKHPKKTLSAAIELGRYLKQKYTIPDTNIFRHYDVTYKMCPKYFVDNPFQWVEFYTSINKG